MKTFNQFVLAERVRTAKQSEKLIDIINKKYGSPKGDIPTDLDYAKNTTVHNPSIDPYLSKNDEVHTVKLPISRLRPLQSTVNSQGVKNKLTDDDNKPLAVMKMGPYHFVLDGHHRLVAAKVKGETKIDCRVLKVPINYLMKQAGVQ